MKIQFKNTKLNKKKILKFNFKLFKPLLHILPNINIRILGHAALLNIKKKRILLYLKFLKNSSNYLFDYLIDIAVIDYPWKKNRFHIRYILRSLTFNKIIYVNIRTQNNKSIFSVSNLYNSSFWVERECWDLFGLFFYLHKNLKRILTDYGFKGNPLKKDFPLIGFKEIFYSIFLNSIITKNINN